MELEEWVGQYPEVKRWLAKIQAREKSAFDLYRFCQWCGKTPVELLALKSNPSSKEAEQLLDDFVADEKTGFTNPVKFNIVSSVKSFFKHNYCDLARASGAISLEKVKPYNKPRKEELRKLWNWALNPRDKALITFVCSTAIAKETLSRLQWKHLEENWEKAELPCINIPSEILKGHGHGRYKGVKQITFLTPEAKRDLLNYKEWIEQKLERNLTTEDNIFLETYAPYSPVAYGTFGSLIWRLSQNAGVPFSWHDARRYVNTALEEIRISPNWARKIRGRKVKGEEAPYSQPAIEQLREKFKEAVPLLEFTSETAAIAKVEERLKTIEEAMESIPLDLKEKMRRLGIRLTKRNSAKPRREKTLPNGGMAFIQKIVEESALEQYLAQGWRITTTLPSGKIVIENINR